MTFIEDFPTNCHFPRISRQSGLQAKDKHIIEVKPFINYVRVPREGGVGKISTYSYFGGG